MTQTNLKITRRQALYGLGGVSALALLPACKQLGLDATDGGEFAALEPDAALEQIGYDMLAHEPARATSLGVDTGDYAAWRGTFGTPGPEGRAQYASTLERLRDGARSYPKDGLTADQLTSFEVVESAFSKALEGFALPYGDVAVGSWRNAPYVVIQNVGAYIDMPRFMGSSQPLSTAEDVDYYLSRLNEIPAVLDGENERMQQARGMGVVPPDFLLDKAIAQMESTIASAKAGDLYTNDFTTNLEKAGLPSDTSAEVDTIVGGPIAAALERQLEELKTQRAEADSDPGIWSQPQGEEYYSWATSASTTTNMTPDEIHEQGLEELAELQGQMDPILKEIGFTTGSVGERMQALSQDSRYKFAEGDPGREEIFAFIDERIEWIKAQMPRAFNELVDPNMEVRRIPINEEPGAPGAYGGAGSKDGSIPGRFWINLRTTDLHRKYDLADLTYHEAIPGHVWEGEYSNRLPLIRS
ncbi:MAG: DUF885 domain-containing protein, partial [Pseudomonadota bacterium]